MTPKQMKAFRERHQMTQEELARAIGVTKTTVGRWEIGRHPIPAIAEAFLRMMDQKNGERQATRKRRK